MTVQLPPLYDRCCADPRQCKRTSTCARFLAPIQTSGASVCNFALNGTPCMAHISIDQARALMAQKPAEKEALPPLKGLS